MHYFKLDEDLYLLVWLEKIVCGTGLIVLDRERGRSVGSMFGCVGDDCKKAAIFPVGSKPRTLNETTYDRA